MEKSNGCTCGQGKSRGKCASCTGGGAKKVATVGGIRAANAILGKKSNSMSQPSNVRTR
jgi:hypothetical protein